MQFKQIDTRKRKQVYEDILKKIDKYENDYLPQVQLDTLEVSLLSCTSELVVSW